MKAAGYRQASVRHRDFRKCDHVAAAILLDVQFSNAKVEPPDWKIFKKSGERFFTRPHHRDMWLWGNKSWRDADEKSRRCASRPGRYEKTQTRGFSKSMKQMIRTQVEDADGGMHLGRKVSARMAAAGGHV